MKAILIIAALFIENNGFCGPKLPPMEKRCTITLKNGKQCRNASKADEEYCKKHLRKVGKYENF